MNIDFSNIQTASAIPGAAAMIETFRAIGYSLETAVADIIDNSISAGAKNIYIIRVWKGGESMHIPADTRSAFPLISVHSPVSIQYRWQS